MAAKAARTIRFRLTLVLSILLFPFVSYLSFLGWSYADDRLIDRAILTGGPILLWLITLAAVWFATDLQMARPVRRLTRAAEAFSRGDLSDRPALAGPAEIRELASMFNEMATRMAGREHELREAIETREVMMREIHHRVKNNLQIVTS